MERADARPTRGANPDGYGNRADHPGRQRRGEQRRRALLLGPHLPARRAGARRRRHRVLPGPGDRRHRHRRGGARGAAQRAHLRPRHEPLEPDGLDERRALVPEPGDARQRQGVRGERRREAREAGLPRPPAGLVRPTSARPRPTTRPPASGATTARRRAAVAAAVPAPAPAPERRRLLQRRGPGVQPVRPGLRRGALEHRRVLRPGDRPLEGPGHPGRWRRARSGTCSTSTSASPVRPCQARHPGRRQEPHAARLPRLHLLGDASAGSPTGSAATRRRRSSRAAAW